MDCFCEHPELSIRQSSGLYHTQMRPYGMNEYGWVNGSVDLRELINKYVNKRVNELVKVPW
jgi:hypothetical protein